MDKPPTKTPPASFLYLWLEKKTRIIQLDLAMRGTLTSFLIFISPFASVLVMSLVLRKNDYNKIVKVQKKMAVSDSNLRAGNTIT